MQAVRLSPEIAASSSDLQTGAGRSDADVDGLAGFPTTDPTDKPEQLSLDLGDEMSLFTRLLTRAAPLPTAPATSAERVEAAEPVARAATRHDVSAQEVQGLFRTTAWGR